MTESLYHLGFGKSDLGSTPPTLALLSGDPQRAKKIADENFTDSQVMSENRGLNSYLGLVNGQPILSSTSGMGAPSLSIIVNELVQLGVKTIIRIGTSGAVSSKIRIGDIVISSAAMCRQGAANDIAPPEYPAVADTLLTAKLMEVAQNYAIPYHLGITASVDTFYEGQGRKGSANPNLLPHLRDWVKELDDLNILNMEMEAATLFKMGSVYGFRAACVCAIVAQRTEAESVNLQLKDQAVENAIQCVMGFLKTHGTT